MGFYGFLGFFLFIFRFLDFFGFFGFLRFFLDFFGFFKKLLRLLLKVTEVTTEHQKWPKISTNIVKSPFFCPKGKKAPAEGQSPPQELEVSPLYLLVILKRTTN